MLILLSALAKPSLLLQVLLEVARSIQYLHSINVIHCDVKVSSSQDVFQLHRAVANKLKLSGSTAHV